MNRFYCGVLTLFFVALSAPVLSAEPSYEEFNQLLGEHTKPIEKNRIMLMGVDYQAWKNDQRHEKAMRRIQGVAHQELKGAEAMAFWINAYNLLTIDLIIKNNETESIKNLGSLFTSPWKKFKWALAGSELSLDDIEHNILRPMGDARVHAAIVCASLSCPDIRNEAFTASKLDAQLDEQFKAFLSNPAKGTKKSEDGVVVSKIFDWFEEDFGDEQGVLKTVNSYLGTKHQKIDSYFYYDWSLNAL